MSENFFFTQDEYDSLLKKLNDMKSKEKTEVQKEISTARAQGDLKENAEYHAARERLSMLMGKISQLETKLANAEIYDPADRPVGEIFVGSKIKMKNLNSGASMEADVVSMPMFDTDRIEISTKSPVGKAILGKKVGDEVDVEGGSGTIRWLIEEVD